MRAAAVLLHRVDPERWRYGPDAAADPALIENPDEILDRIDALVLAGGCDIDPAHYGQEQHPETVGLVPPRDEFEFALLERAIERDMPTLCICRGMQVLNVSAAAR